MAKVNVCRQTVDADNLLSWEVIAIDEKDLLDGEMPHEELE